MSVVEILTLLGGGALATEIVRGAVAALTKRSEGDTALTLADKTELGRINQATQQRLERQVDKLLEEFMEAKESASQLAIAKAILEFKVGQLEKQNADLAEHAAQLQSRLNGGTNGGG